MDAAIDENGVKTIIGALNTDGKTPTRILVNPSNHSLKVNNGTSGTDHGTKNAVRDGNGHPVLLAVSSSDGKTPVELYVDSSGFLLIQST